jgi:serine/threonine-protein kinase
MGAVVAAEPLGGGPVVAVKLMLPRLAVDPRFVARFLREARATMGLTSEHAPRVVELGALESGAPFLAMEYLEGTDLRALVRERGPLAPAVAADYVAQACDAIAEAHARGIVHRDLKPANLFLASRAGAPPIVKVLDFGVAKLRGPDGAGDGLEMTRTGTVLGSRLYMAPEQMRSPREVDGRADVWALGVCLYFLLTGTTPFAAETTEEVIVHVLLHPPPPLRERAPDVPAALEQIVLRCLEKAASRRFATAGELAAALAPLAGRAPIAAPIAAPTAAAAPSWLEPTAVLEPEATHDAVTTAGPWSRAGAARQAAPPVARRARLGGLALLGVLAGAGLTLGALGLGRGGAVAPAASIEVAPAAIDRAVAPPTEAPAAVDAPLASERPPAPAAPTPTAASTSARRAAPAASAARATSNAPAPPKGPPPPATGAPPRAEAATRPDSPW